MAALTPLRILAGVATVVALACARTGLAAVAAIDDAGSAVTLPRPAQRIVSLAPHATELLFAAGAGHAVVGVVAHSDWPPAARALPRVGDAAALDLERIVALAPELIVAWPYTTPAQLAALRAQRIAVFVSDPKSIAGIADDVEKLGALAGTKGTAQPVAAALRARRAALAAQFAAAPRVSVFYEVWHEPLYTVGGRHLISEAIATCGGDNVFAALTLPAPSVTVEAVVAARPDVIVGGADDGGRPPWLDAWKRWPAIPAVRDGNLFAADGNLLHRPGPRFLDGVAALCADLDLARGRRQR
ncbi:MAG: cobalamin-binding protein [Betaproteobacteria bacterium]|nr:cobalamin-binding protein [Betaproteobacteria bacterium]MCC7216382.1 cobalamin-binding protein [Burkholderiales bacterium]